MSKVWAERGLDEKAARLEAKRQYQQREMALEEERTRLSRMEGEFRTLREELARGQRTLEQRQLDILNLEKQQRNRARSLDEFADRITAQKRTVARVEHEAERLREESS